MTELNENVDYTDLKDAFTIDPYYDINFYNQTKICLTNNEVDYEEMILTKAPYAWYFVSKQSPIAINFDRVSSSMIKFLVTKVKPLNFNDEYRLYRKGGQKLNDSVQFIENDALAAARKSSYACFFNVKSKSDLKSISDTFPGKLYFLGKYYNNKYNVCLALHETIEGVIPADKILLRKGSLNGIGQFESEFNFKVLKNKDFLIKFTESPYMEDGRYHNVKIQGDRIYKSKYILS